MSEANRTRINEVFNLGFRQGANDRAAAGLSYLAKREQPTEIPEPPLEGGSASEKESWQLGYRMGYVIGAADSE